MYNFTTTRLFRCIRSREKTWPVRSLPPLTPRRPYTRSPVAPALHRALDARLANARARSTRENRASNAVAISYRSRTDALRGRTDGMYITYTYTCTYARNMGNWENGRLNHGHILYVTRVRERVRKPGHPNTE